MSDLIMQLDDTNFSQAALEPGTRVVVDFWAPWCVPCQTIERHLEKRAPDFAGKLLFVKVNADEAEETAANYHVRGLSTLIFLKDGQHQDTVIGALNPAKMDAILKKWSET